MGYFVKKTLTGYKEVPGGYSDPDAEYYIQTIEEYQADRTMVENVKNVAAQVKRDAEDRVQQSRYSMGNQLIKYKQQVKDEADRRVAQANVAVVQKNKRLAELEAELAQTKELLKNANYLNRNLKRIARERANQKRGITPKKEHDGYLVLSSRQWMEHYDYIYTDEEYEVMDSAWKNKHKKPYIEHRTVDVWKSIIQTPYDASLPLSQIRGMIEDDDLWNGGVLKEIGCPCMSKNENNGKYTAFGKNDDGYEQNGCYKWKFWANYRSGFWELEIFTTKSLQVPVHRRPVDKKSKVDKPKKKAGYADDSQMPKDFGWQ